MVARVCAAIAFGTWSYVALAGSSLAQPSVANPQRGHELATRLCTNCHVIDRQPSSTMRADVPRNTAAVQKRRGDPAALSSVMARGIAFSSATLSLS